MIWERCEVEMNLAETIQLNFTSPNFAQLGHFRVPKEERSVEKYVCPECGAVQYAPEVTADEQSEDKE